MSGSRANTWMPLYIGDYLADTMHLDTREHGAYLLLIFAYWRSGMALRDDDKWLAGICKATAKQWQDMRPTLSQFFSVEDGLWRHKRIDAELEKASGITETRRSSGSIGASAKWGGSTPAAATRSQRLAAARALGTHTKIEWSAMLGVFGHKCVKCGTHADNARGGICKDHIKPIYQGGSDAIWNLQPLCTSCNSAKGPDSTDHRPIACQDWEERLAKCLANASQTPGPSPSQSHSSLRSEVDTPHVPPGSKRGARLSQDWQPAEQSYELGAELGFDRSEVDAEVPEFRDYWCGVPGQKGCKLDWDATFNNRLRDVARRRKREAQRSGRMVHRQGPNSLIAAARAVAAQIEGEQ